MGGLEFRHIEAFRAVILHGGASSAARSLGLSQPAVSKTIAQAEHLIGFSLFDRRNGRLIPTMQAQLLYEQTESLFSTLERVNDIVARMAKGAMTPISIGVVPLLSMTLLPAVVRSGLVEHGHTVAINATDSVTLTRQVAAGQLEFALVSAMHDLDGVESAVLSLSPVFCAVPVDHPLAAKSRIRLEDLDGEPYIGLSTSEEIQTGFDQLFQKHGVKPREVIRCPLMAAAVAIAEEGVGLTFVDAFGMRLAQRGTLRFIALEPACHIEYRAIWPQGMPPNFTRREFLTRCRQQAKSIVMAAAAQD